MCRIGAFQPLWRPPVCSLHTPYAYAQVQRTTFFETSAAGRVGASLSVEAGPGRSFSLRALYASNGLNGFSTGDADYRYVSVSLTGSWNF